MRTTHTSLPFADHALHFVEFDPASCHDHDLLWLPHHAQLLSSGRKRKAEHLAGRIAAVHALREFGLKTVPGIGTQRQPVWPQGLHLGSISHSASTALAVVSRQPVGIDIEAILRHKRQPNWQVALSLMLRKNCWQTAACLLNRRSPWRFPPKRALLKQPGHQDKQTPGLRNIKSWCYSITR